MPDAVIFGQHDPLSEKTMQPYAYGYNNPIRYGDPTGLSGNDFVERKDGSIYWDKNANSQAMTKAGETYLGKTLNFTFTSYIDKKLWDVPSYVSLGFDATGVKLTSNISITGRENSAGELTSIVSSSNVTPGETPIGEPRLFYPGEGGSNNLSNTGSTSTGVNYNFEQHMSVSKFKELGLNAMGYKIVDVAQKLNINFNNSNGNLSVSAYTNIFPSATLKLNNTNSTLMQYNQPSFIGTHSATIRNNAAMGRGGVESSVKSFSYYPSRFYKRN